MKSRPIVTVAAVLAVLLPVAYVGLYYGMIKYNKFSQQIERLSDGRNRGEPIYRSDWRPLRLLLLPMHEVDRVLRPGYWKDPWEPEEWEFPASGTNRSCGISNHHSHIGHSVCICSLAKEVRSPRR